jgi:hypothetical protein
MACASSRRSKLVNMAAIANLSDPSMPSLHALLAVESSQPALLQSEEQSGQNA